MTQKEIKGLKVIKVRSETYDLLCNLIKKVEKRQPYLRGLVGFNAVIQMLLLKKKINLSKYRLLVRK